MNTTNGTLCDTPFCGFAFCFPRFFSVCSTVCRSQSSLVELTRSIVLFYNILLTLTS